MASLIRCGNPIFDTINNQQTKLSFSSLLLFCELLYQVKELCCILSSVYLHSTSLQQNKSHTKTLIHNIKCTKTFMCNKKLHIKHYASKEASRLN